MGGEQYDQDKRDLAVAVGKMEAAAGVEAASMHGRRQGRRFGPITRYN